MEMSLIKKNGTTWTRFKISKKEQYIPAIYLYVKFGIDIKNPVKENSRYMYFEKEGDWLNGK